MGTGNSSRSSIGSPTQSRADETPSFVDDSCATASPCEGSPDGVGTALAERFGGKVDRVSLSPQGWLGVVAVSAE